MRRIRVLSTIGIGFFAVASLMLGATAQTQQEGATRPPAQAATYLGQTPPGEKAEVFAPEVLKYEPHDSPLISRDETWFVFFGMDVGVMFYRLTNGQLTTTSNSMGLEIPEVCNGMAVSPSWNRVYIREWKDGRGHLYFIDRIEDGWTSPKYLELDSFNKTWQFSVAANENLYFATDRIMVAAYNGESHTEPVPLKLDDNSDMRGGSPYVAPDESYTIYSIEGDLHISYNLNNGKWTRPIDLGANINSDQLELCPQISPNGKYLIFNSRRDFPQFKIYWADASFVEKLRPKE